MLLYFNKVYIIEPSCRIYKKCTSKTILKYIFDYNGRLF